MLTSLDFDKVANALLVFVVGLLSYLGVRGGRRSTSAAGLSDAGGDVTEVAGALIDNKKAEQIIAAFNANTKTQVELVAATAANSKAIAEKTKAVEANTIAIQRMSDVVAEEMRLTRNRIVEIGTDIRHNR